MLQDQVKCLAEGIYFALISMAPLSWTELPTCNCMSLLTVPVSNIIACPLMFLLDKTVDK
jgi:hypothetical protein